MFLYLRVRKRFTCAHGGWRVRKRFSRFDPDAVLLPFDGAGKKFYVFHRGLKRGLFVCFRVKGLGNRTNVYSWARDLSLAFHPFLHGIIVQGTSVFEEIDFRYFPVRKTTNNRVWNTIRNVHRLFDTIDAWRVHCVRNLYTKSIFFRVKIRFTNIYLLPFVNEHFIVVGGKLLCDNRRRRDS